MLFEEIIQKENSDIMYDRWSRYRNGLTSYILKTIEAFYIREALRKKRQLKLKKGQMFMPDSAEKPTLAIWGAGGLNDIDAALLAERLRLVLIDDNLEAVGRACKKYGLPEDVVCIDMKFWDIPAEKYHMLEDLMSEGVEVDIISRYLREIFDKMHICNFDGLPKFDFSVVSGLASQLNARLWRLVRSFPGYEALEPILREYNLFAVNRLFSCVESVTGKLSIWGYEVLSSPESSGILTVCEAENELWHEVINSMPRDVFWKNLTEVSIEGSVQLDKLICESYVNEKKSVLNGASFLWPFSDRKDYMMRFVTTYNEEEM